MLVLSDAIFGVKVLSLHVAKPIAKVADALIDPSKLKIEAFSVRGGGIRYFSAIFTGDVREWGPMGLIVNSEDVIMEVDDNLPRLKGIVEDEFELVGARVRTESGKRLGKVVRFVFETEGFFVVKIYVDRISTLGLGRRPLIIERDSIVDVKKKHIIVKDAHIKNKTSTEKTTQQSYEFSPSLD